MQSTRQIDPQISWLLKDKYHIVDIQNFTSTPKIAKDLDLLKSGYPVDYLIGWTTFLDCHIDLSHKPLIPRPETEFWVGKVIGKYVKSKRLSVLDLCCGSGCIGLAVLKNIPSATVDFADIGRNALTQTGLNLKLNQIPQTRYRLFRSDLFTSLPPKKYDLILSNPPYVDPCGEYQSSLKYEPATALFAPDHGLFFIKSILDTATQYLTADGSLYLEFAFGQKKFISQHHLRKNIHFHLDQYAKFRFLDLTAG